MRRAEPHSAIFGGAIAPLAPPVPPPLGEGNDSYAQGNESILKECSHGSAEGADNFMKFVEVYGLRSIFPAFMKTPEKSKKVDISGEEHEEHVHSTFSSLFRNV